MSQQLWPTLGLIGLSVITGVAGQTVLKLGVASSGPRGVAVDPVAIVTLILRSPLVLFGFLLYGVGALAWVVVLSRLDLSYAYPFLALNFVLVAIVSQVVLSESVPMVRWLGIGCICVGILLVARSAAR
ncbi:MAG: hypothetical protein M5U01_18880 [Ardenticatenaceae bacterium]|nr:hypothetical protein [Ardenticatenaceae bacterium]HBY94942.1 multidrug resistance protein [Chloroflexota bacterium]